MPRLTLFAILLAAAALASPTAKAQMFGERQLGGFLSRRNSPGAMSNPAEALINSGGMLNGNERFLRSNRGVNDFVGMQDRRGFVGVTQARERRTPPAAASLRERTRPNVNQMLAGEQPARDGIYSPRLVLSPGLSGPTRTEIARSLEAHLERAPLEWTRPLRVTMQGETAILQGEVATSRERALAEALVRLEPGVYDVQNDLRVAAQRPLPPEPPRAQVPESRLVPPQQAQPPEAQSPEPRSSEAQSPETLPREF